ncbi:ribosomal-protein-serine acetyltransferase [Salirhabdus euzebyi]|uniref:Ribosomal-protein-serine acetyltransferase n=1 Tax=Salirhabdus euzebyi TaxID=394506 RepID=A0A841Q6Z8_9BACI|nr:GNAT family protein [Salirhabdus euzebyi]MBB6454155.1 ribosomal-protein-serine acetyltransferase [Salirhabdus euzebyi]
MFIFPVNQEISLKLLEKRDATKMIQAINDSRNYLREWLPWVDNMKVEEDYYPVIEMWIMQLARNDGFQAGIIYQNELVGMAGYHSIDWKNKQTSIGYWLAHGYQGKGIMTKVTEKLVSHAFTEYNLNRVEIRCGVENRKSRAIPERLGFHQEGIIRDGEYLYDHYHDVAIYSKLAAEWTRK